MNDIKEIKRVGELNALMLSKLCEELLDVDIIEILKKKSNKINSAYGLKPIKL